MLPVTVAQVEAAAPIRSLGWEFPYVEVLARKRRIKYNIAICGNIDGLREYYA